LEDHEEQKQRNNVQTPGAKNICPQTTTQENVLHAKTKTTKNG